MKEMPQKNVISWNEALGGNDVMSLIDKFYQLLGSGRNNSGEMKINKTGNVGNNDND